MLSCGVFRDTFLCICISWNWHLGLSLIKFWFGGLVRASAGELWSSIKMHVVSIALPVILAIYYFQVSCLISLYLQLLRGQLTVASRPWEHMPCVCGAVRGQHSPVSNQLVLWLWFYLQKDFRKGKHGLIGYPQRGDMGDGMPEDQWASERGSWSRTPLALPPVPCPEPGRLNFP